MAFAGHLAKKELFKVASKTLASSSSGYCCQDHRDFSEDIWIETKTSSS